MRRQQQSDFPWRRLPINFTAASKGKSVFTEEEDTFILNLTTLLGNALLVLLQPLLLVLLLLPVLRMLLML